MIQPKTAGAKDALSRMQAFNQAPSLPVGSISAAAAKMRMTIMTKTIFHVMLP